MLLTISSYIRIINMRLCGMLLSNTICVFLFDFVRFIAIIETDFYRIIQILLFLILISIY